MGAAIKTQQRPAAKMLAFVARHVPASLSSAACIRIMVAVVFILALSLGLGFGLRHHHSFDRRPQASALPAPSSPPTQDPASHHPEWLPTVGQSWQIILNRPLVVVDGKKIHPDVDVYDIDLFNNDQATFSALRKKGKRSICYFSAGSYEPYRPDSKDFRDIDLGKGLEGWPDERWLNVSSPVVRNIMSKRIELAATKGCDAIDPDNVDGFGNNNGLGLTRNDAVNYILFLSQEASKYKLAIGLKNAVDIIKDVLTSVDFAVNEKCSEYDECHTLEAFIDISKPVFHIEYPDRRSGGVPSDNDRKKCCANFDGTSKFSTVIKDLSLDGWVQYCNGSIYETSTS